MGRYRKTAILSITLVGFMSGIGAGFAVAQPQNLPDLAEVTLVPFGGAGGLEDPPQIPMFPSWRVEPGNRTMGAFAGRPIHGRVTIRQLQNGFQEAELVVPGESTPMILTVRLPFPLNLWMGDGLDGSFDYRPSDSPLMNSRSIEMADTTGVGLVLMDRRRDDPIRMEYGGISIEQRDGGRSGGVASHTYWYPVPALVRAGGAVTLLWQRQAVVVPTLSGSGRTAVVVLASEVAKPIGRSAHLFEGPRYNLDLLLLQIDG